MKLLYSEEIIASNKTLNGTSPNTFTTFGGIEKSYNLYTGKRIRWHT